MSSKESNKPKGSNESKESEEAKELKRPREPKRLEELEDSRGPRVPEDSERIKGMIESGKKLRLLGLETELSEPERHDDQEQEGAEALLVMAGISTEPTELPKKIYCRNKNKEREVTEAQVDEADASLEATYRDTSHESIGESLDLVNIDKMVKMLAAQEARESGEDQM